MADRYPLIANPATSQIQELASGDNIDLTGNDIVGVKDITATGTISTTGQISAGGISYPTTTGNDGQVLTSDGAGGSAWEDSSVSGLPSGDAGESIVFDGNNWVLSPPNFAVETTASDPDWNSVTMLIPFNTESGTPGTASWSTPVYGSIAGTDYVSAGVSTEITSVGTVELDDRAPGVQRIKFGTGAGRFQGSDTGYMEFDGANAGSLYNLGSGDFTLEFWFLLDDLTNNQQLVSVDSTSGSYDNGCWFIIANSNGTMSFYDHWTSTHHYIESNGGVAGIQADTWYHCAVSRINDELRGYLNGIKQFEATVDTNFTTDANSISYGARLRLGFGDTNSNDGMNGNLDDFRITIGTGRYDSANFTPPTQGFATTATPTYGDITYPLTLHTDVDLLTNPPSNGQVFTWDATGGSGNNGAWIPTTISGGTTDTIEEGNSSVEVTDSGSDGTIQFTTDGTARWKITNGGHILPNANASFDIGSAEYKIRHLFLSNNSLWVGDQHKISVTGGKMKFRKRKTSTVPASITDAGGDEAGALAHSGKASLELISCFEWLDYLTSLDPSKTDLSDLFPPEDSSGYTDDDYEEIISQEGAGRHPAPIVSGGVALSIPLFAGNTFVLDQPAGDISLDVVGATPTPGNNIDFKVYVMQGATARTISAATIDGVPVTSIRVLGATISNVLQVFEFKCLHHNGGWNAIITAE